MSPRFYPGESIAANVEVEVDGWSRPAVRRVVRVSPQWRFVKEPKEQNWFQKLMKRPVKHEEVMRMETTEEACFRILRPSATHGADQILAAINVYQGNHWIPHPLNFALCIKDRTGTLTVRRYGRILPNGRYVQP